MFLETICILQGEIQNKHGHECRMLETASHFGFNMPALPDLRELLPDKLLKAKVKCRISYHSTIKEITFEQYLPKKIESLRMTEASPDYSFKYTDRKSLTALLTGKGNCDEILITRNGLITDTSYSNVVFRKGNQFFTPDSYLLNGTKRQKLLYERKIKERRITTVTMYEYDRIFLINALLDIDDDISLSLDNIVR